MSVCKKVSSAGEVSSTRGVYNNKGVANNKGYGALVRGAEIDEAVLAVGHDSDEVRREVFG
jgi:hypothetical protein